MTKSDNLPSTGVQGYSIWSEFTLFLKCSGKAQNKCQGSKPGFQICLYVWFLSLRCFVYSPQSSLIVSKLNFLLTVRKPFLERPKIFLFCLNMSSLQYIGSNYNASNWKGRKRYSCVRTGFRISICNIVHVYAFRSEQCMMLTPWPFGSECSVNLTELRVLHLSPQLTK